jgi:uncharacterized protein YodC (DUF2158 family)
MILNPKAGDKVRAKSGGPVMTVGSVESDVYGETTVVCHWVGDDSKPASGTFTVASLAKP